MIHLLAFGALYLTVIQLCCVAQDHYAKYGIADTLEFSRLQTVSNYVCGYSPFFVFLVFAETLFVARCSRKRKTWASAYSPAVVFIIGFAMFVSTAWMIHPMAWSVPATGVAPVAADARPEASIVAETHADDDKRKFPAEIRVVSHETDDQGRLRIRVRLLINDHVAIYANPVRAPGMDHASARITVLDANRKPLRANVTYPTGDKLHAEFMGDWYLYRKSVEFDVVLAENPPLPLIVRAKIAGYNERKLYCLGVGEIETKLKPEPEISKP